VAKILVIEDDRNIAEVVGKHLTAAGHQCRLETSGAQALEIARQDPQDLFIVDVMLPGPSGFEICRRIRSDANLYTTPILILSAMRGEEEVMHGLAQGADDYMVKPFEAGQLVQRVEALLRAVGNNIVDRLTSLPGIDAIRREIQRRISLRQVFGFAYIELLHIRQFGFKCGADARDKAIRHLARGLASSGEAASSDDYYIGHMGNGHFVCLLPPDRAQDFCERAHKLWLSHREGFYKSANLEAAYRAAAGITEARQHTVPLLDMLCCITVHDRKHDTTPQKLFEVLSQLRHKALATKGGGVFIDQRV
jgi:CheY-like chemotaxis protein